MIETYQLSLYCIVSNSPVITTETDVLLCLCFHEEIVGLDLHTTEDVNR